MCYFITIAVPRIAEGQLVASIPRGFALDPCHHPSIAQNLPSDYAAFFLTSGMCSCDLFSRGHEAESLEHPRDRLRKRYAKRQWSTAKVERAIEASLAVQKPDSAPPGYDERLRHLIADFAEVHGDVEMVAHFYNGDVRTERFSMTRGGTISPATCRSGEFESGEDQIVSISQNRVT